MSCNTITIGGTQVVTLTGLIDSITSAYQNAATVAGELFESDRTTSLGTFTMSYVAASDGNYRGTIAAAVTATLTEGTEYRIKVTATVATNVKPFWLDVTAVY
jgi:hypothetical protein